MYLRARSIACVVLLVGSLAGQDLLRATPADSVVYARVENPWKTLSSLAGFLPSSSREGAAAQTDALLEWSNGLIGLEAGTLSGWMKTVTMIEHVLGGLRLGDIEPEADWTLAFHTPLAETIYDKITDLLVEQAVADRDEGFTSITTEKTDLLIGRHGNALILASSKGRLDAAVAGLRAAPAEGLAKTARFRRALGEPAGAPSSSIAPSPGSSPCSSRVTPPLSRPRPAPWQDSWASGSSKTRGTARVRRGTAA